MAVVMRMALTSVILAALAAPALAQEAPKPEQLQKLYDDAMEQLKRAQNRNNELANDNAKLQKALVEARQRIDQLSDDADQFAERSYQLRQWRSAWNQFINQYPGLKWRWQAFMQSQALDAAAAPAFLGDNWPFDALK